MTKIPILPTSQMILQAREKWQYTGAQRPDFAEPTEPGQESVWDYPRPPRIEPVPLPVTVLYQDQIVASTTRAVRVLETAGAPTIYFPPEDVNEALVEFGEPTSICEWKGLAQAIHVGDIRDAGWRYMQMFSEFTDLYLWPSFYPGKLDCIVGEEQARPQPGGYYGGWVTDNIRGPIKGEPGSGGW